jgi:hypothetical protein
MLSVIVVLIILHFCPDLIASYFLEPGPLYLNRPLSQTAVPGYSDVQVDRFVRNSKEVIEALSQTNVRPTFSFYDIASHRLQYSTGVALMEKIISPTNIHSSALNINPNGGYTPTPLLQNILS